MTLMQAVLAVLASAAVIVVAGTFLARSGDVIAARTGLGGAWVGSVLLAAATSLPEIMTDISAVRMGAVDLAASDLFGTSMANTMILAIITLMMAIWIVLDAAHGPGPIFAAISPVHALSALVAVGLMGIGIAALVYRAQGRYTLLEPRSALIVLGYVAGLALVLAESLPG